MAESREMLNKESSRISGMFNGIAPSYDLLNHLLSLNIDKYWRRGMVHFLKGTFAQTESINRPAPRVLDIACGSGDSAIALYKQGMVVTGADIAEKMLEVAVKKNEKLKKKGLAVPVPAYILASAEALPFPDNSFDAVTISFGIRNFNRREKCLKEIYRVIKSEGVLAILEFAKPRNPLIRFIYNLYFNNMLPFVGNIISKDKGAYKYLAESVEQFPRYDAFCKEIETGGFTNVTYKKYTSGIALLYTGKKLP